jgi:hypothetical protein
MKSYSKKSPFNNKLIPGLLINGRRPPGIGWVEVGEKVTCPDPDPDPDDPEEPSPPPMTIPIPAELVTTTEDPKIRIISQSVNGTLINTDYMVDTMSMSATQLQIYLTQNLGSWGFWNVIQGQVALVAYSTLRVNRIQIFQKLLVLEPVG